MKIYVVTGATGFVGNNVVRKLTERGQTVYALCRSKEKSKVLESFNCKIFLGDICDYNYLKSVCSDKTHQYVIIHTAAVVSIDPKHAGNMHEVNIKGTQNVITLCKEINAKLVYLSSVQAFPASNKKIITESDNFDVKSVAKGYAKSKCEATAMVSEAVKEGLNAVIVHPTGIIGPNDYSNTHTTQFIIDYFEGRIPIAVKGGFDFVDVRDIANGILLAEEKSKSGSNYILTGEYVSVKTLLNLLYKHYGGKKIKLTLPLWVAYLGLPFLTLYSKIKKTRQLYTTYSLNTIKGGRYSSKKAETELGYIATPIEQSIIDSVEFLKQQGKIALNK